MESKRVRGFIDFPGGFRLLSSQPIDYRYLGEDKSFLDGLIEAGGVYPGLKVFIKSENKYYVYKKNLSNEYGFIEDSDGSSSVTVDSELSETSTNPVQNKVVKEALGGKLDKIVKTGGYFLYSITPSGVTTTRAIANTAGNATHITIPQYFTITHQELDNEPGASLSTAMPQKPYAATPKKYVDDLFNSISDSGQGVLVITDISFPNGISVDTAKAIMHNFHYLDSPTNTCCIVRNGDDEVGVVLSRKYFEEGTATIQQEITELCIAVGPKIYKYTHTLTRDLENNFAETEKVSAPTIYDIENKVDLYTPTYSSSWLYGVRRNSLGNISRQPFVILSTPRADAIPIMGNGGVLPAGTPTQPTHAVNLQYAQENFSPKLYRHDIKITVSTGDNADTAELIKTLYLTSSNKITKISEIAQNGTNFTINGWCTYSIYPGQIRVVTEACWYGDSEGNVEMFECMGSLWTTDKGFSSESASYFNAAITIQDNIF